jgi:hypothetical protein
MFRPENRRAPSGETIRRSETSRAATNQSGAAFALTEKMIFPFVTVMILLCITTYSVGEKRRLLVGLVPLWHRHRVVPYFYLSTVMTSKGAGTAGYHVPSRVQVRTHDDVPGTSDFRLY